jgi:hypothetical protein
MFQQFEDRFLGDGVCFAIEDQIELSDHWSSVDAHLSCDVYANQKCGDDSPLPQKKLAAPLLKAGSSKGGDSGKTRISVGESATQILNQKTPCQ